MPAAAVEASHWSDHPFDLLRDISRRLHAAGDYVRFHAVCEPWHDTLPPAAKRPFFLPWLLTRRDDTDGGHHETDDMPPPELLHHNDDPRREFTTTELIITAGF
ncbi:unnamed protein product [Urochloa humidicola]